MREMMRALKAILQEERRGILEWLVAMPTA